MEKKLTAAQVKKLPAGTTVIYHFPYGDGEESFDGIVVQSGRGKKLRREIGRVITLRPIKDYQPGGYFTEVP